MSSPAEYWLSLDLASPTGTLALHRWSAGEPRLLVESSIGGQFQHSERLLGALADALSTAGLELSRISRFITASGPGSFTGLRIAMATLKAFALATHRPIETVDGSEARALAWARRHPMTDGRQILVVTYISLDRSVQARFRADGASWRLETERLEAGIQISPEERSRTLMLLDERTKEEALGASTVEAHPFGLRASYLGEALLHARSRETFSQLAEWISLSPRYFGGGHLTSGKA